MTIQAASIDPMISEGVMAVGTAAAGMLVISMFLFTAWSLIRHLLFSNPQSPSEPL